MEAVFPRKLNPQLPQMLLEQNMRPVPLSWLCAHAAFRFFAASMQASQLKYPRLRFFPHVVQSLCFLRFTRCLRAASLLYA